MAASYRMKYLLHFVQENSNFVKSELSSLLRLAGENPDHYAEEISSCKNSMHILPLQSEETVHKIMSRSVLCKYAFEFWAKGSTFDELVREIHSLPEPFLNRYTNSSTSFRVFVSTVNKPLSNAERIEKIEAVVGSVGFQGPVCLSDTAENTFHLIEYHPIPPDSDSMTFYFGRKIAEGHRDAIAKYDLKKRICIGNTTMDPLLALIMANLSLAEKGSLVLDPFAGTGGILLACAHFGAVTLGTELDFNLVHGRGRSSRKGQKWRRQEETVLANFRQYSLDSYLADMLLADASLPPFRSGLQLDAIVTDPPYGVREGARKVGFRAEPYIVPPELVDMHHPQKCRYTLSNVFGDLIDFAARQLKCGGRLVFWMPYPSHNMQPEDIPSHPAMKLVHYDQQMLNSRTCRYLIVMEKLSGAEGSGLSYSDSRLDSFRSHYFSEMSE